MIIASSLDSTAAKTHYYFYIRDEVLGPMPCVGSFLSFPITYCLNGHHYVERELIRKGIGFRKDRA